MLAFDSRRFQADVLQARHQLQVFSPLVHTLVKLMVIMTLHQERLGSFQGEHRVGLVVAPISGVRFIQSAADLPMQKCCLRRRLRRRLRGRLCCPEACHPAGPGQERQQDQNERGDAKHRSVAPGELAAAIPH